MKILLHVIPYSIRGFHDLALQLNFIDQVDHYNRMRQKAPLSTDYSHNRVGKGTRAILSGREKTFSNFLFYRLFYGNPKPTILCEGKTDNIYLKSAISELSQSYPQLSKGNGDDYELLVHFVKYSRRSRFLLELFGGADYLRGFIDNFERNIKVYAKITPEHPVIIFLDNDTGPDTIVNLLKDKGFQKKISLIPSTLDKKEDIRKSDFIHVVENLYIIFTPLTHDGKKTDIEHFFDDKTRLMKHPNGKFFNTLQNRDSKIDLSKDAFSTHIIKEKKKQIDFSGLKPLLDSIVKVIDHYDSIKK